MHGERRCPIWCRAREVSKGRGSNRGGIAHEHRHRSQARDGRAAPEPRAAHGPGPGAAGAGGEAEALRRARSAVSEAPDFAEPIIGWRVWRVVGRRSKATLASLFFQTPWLPLEPVRATCAQTRIA